LADFVEDLEPVEHLSFQVIQQDSQSHARLGRVVTAHSVIETPVFMPVGTQGTVKALTQEMLEQLDARIILGNTYHLFLRPGLETMLTLGGLHKFNAWPRSILTDSGGFQVFSLSDIRKLKEEGVEFRSHLDGSKQFLSPEISMRMQHALGSDIVMCFDECTPYPSTHEEVRRSLELTSRWAARSRAEFDWLKNTPESTGQAMSLFGIVQGGVFQDLRRQSLDELVEIGFEGYAIGGLSVGEEKSLMYDTTEFIAPQLPTDKPRYLMGVGTPEDLVESVARGVDMFDCVMPTRNARNGQVFTAIGRVNIKNAKYARDERPLDVECECAVCCRYSRAYVRHLYQAGEILASILCSYHNLAFFLDTMRRVRQAIALDGFAQFRTSFLAKIQSGAD
jgi:queuine tRNA-ribosyltransferase